MGIPADELVEFLSRPAPRELAPEFEERVQKALFAIPPRVLFALVGVVAVMMPLTIILFALKSPGNHRHLLLVGGMMLPLALIQVFVIRFMLRRVTRSLLPHGVFTVGRITKLMQAQGGYFARVVFDWDGKEITATDGLRPRWRKTVKECIKTDQYVGILVNPAKPKHIMIPGKLLGKEEAYAFALTDDGASAEPLDFGEPCAVEESCVQQR